MVIDIVVYPSKVQGIGAENEIVKGIEYFNTRDDIDTIIIARGGGSFEDLAPFNTEVVARAIFCSEKPIISAVGHETDFTICDFAADLRVPTPSVAAEVAVYDYDNTKNKILQTCQINYVNIKNRILKLKEDLKISSDLLSSKILLKSKDYVSNIKIALSNISEAVNKNFMENKNKFMVLSGVISKLNPLEVLRNGYVVIETDNKKISSIQNLNEGDEIKIRMQDGIAFAKVNKKEELENKNGI